MLTRCAGLMLALGVGSGCFNRAAAELSAGQALHELAGQMRQVLDEYHADLARADDSREAAAVQAFIARVNAAQGDAARQEQSALLLTEALERVRADRAAAVQRYIAGGDHVSLLDDMSRDLHRLGLARLRLDEQIGAALAHTQGAFHVRDEGTGPVD